ncbi:copper chaperone PCu(A)C [Motilibacter aurantiacus]|uniref:copper chaperone PCu(A)C n=1 Tax=Motilibacter aurantiacus TaxID=2714955 RepID=UPI00140DC4D1|nr:copper chaperone PCu(A)C [Motilibacter aurantiacus]NHC44274.1 copper chaperone PCu(A)C [Motilibacter aurantiacus]
MNVRRRTTALLLALPLVLATGCGSSDSGTSGGVAAAATGAVDAAATSPLVMSDGWVKAAESGMSAGFGVLRNDSDEQVTVTAATSDVSPEIELHETVEGADGQMMMQEKAGGFVIPAHSTYALQPGASHLMLMSLNGALQAGDEVEFTLTLSNGSDYTFTVPVKDYQGANERYVPGGEMEMGGGPSTPAPTAATSGAPMDMDAES